MTFPCHGTSYTQTTNRTTPAISYTLTAALTNPTGLFLSQVNNLHPGLEDVDLKDAFEPFGFLELVQVARDPSSRQALGYGFVQVWGGPMFACLAFIAMLFKTRIKPLFSLFSAQYREFADGVKAMQHWNGKQLGGKQLEVQMAPLPTAVPTLLPPPPMLSADMLAGMAGSLAGMLPGGGALPGPPGLPAGAGASFMAQQLAAQAQQAQFTSINELDEADEEGKGGLRLDAQKRMALMQRLAAAAGMDGPKPIGAAVPHTAPVQPQVSQTVMLDQGLLGPASPIPTPCILLKNMFDPAEEEARGEPNWVAEVEQDVKEECSRFGEVHHIHVDRNSKGFVYIRFAQQQGAEAAHRALNLRWYSGKQVGLAGMFDVPLSIVHGGLM